MMKNYIFTEKHRPKTYDDVIGMPEKLRLQLDNLTEKMCILLTGTPGTGKTTTSKILVNKHKENAITLNASDERGIDVVRNRIKNFATNASIDGGVRIINLEEFDEMTANAQNALRNLMEEIPNVVWILTGNYEANIVDAIKNRCDHYRFIAPDKNEVHTLLNKIIDSEKIKINNVEIIEKILNNHYPSIRGMVKELQRLTFLGREVTLKDVESSKEDLQKIYTSFSSKNFSQTRQLAIDSAIDYPTIIIYLHDKILKDEKVNPANKLEAILIMGDSLRHIKGVPSKEIEFETMIYNCFKVM